MMLSAFVYPGAGQILQRRRGAGTAYAVLFTLFLIILIFDVFRPMIHNLLAVLDWAAEGDNAPLEKISLAGVVVPFALGLAIYVMNLFDVARANRRMSARPPPLV